MPAELIAIVKQLREFGGDTANIEAKSAAGGLPESLLSSLCSISNLPGGGMVILGLNESQRFRPVPLANIPVLMQGIASRARACEPPVQLTFLDSTESMFEGHQLIVARIAECDPTLKPCRVTSTRKAWVRAWDGDYTMSELEETGFRNQRQHPRIDQNPVHDSSLDDLDQALLATWEKTVRELDPNGLGKFSGEELLVRAGVITKDHIPTVAGILALGIHPQQFFPRFILNVSVRPIDGSPLVRAVEPKTLTGPIPVMLESALEWAAIAFPRYLATDPDGALRDKFKFPLDAFRELISNALVHRDLLSWSEGLAIDVKVSADRLIISNPGGLYGITVDRLGKEGTTSARNSRLIEICKFARSKDGGRVVETLASGIPKVITATQQAGMPSPIFQDAGIRFTVILRARVFTPQLNSPEVVLRGSAIEVASQLTSEPQTATELALSLGLNVPNVRKILRGLIASEIAIREGGQGKKTTYMKNPSAPPIIVGVNS